ncbi:MAG: PIG-L deacetylase family protein [Promethearchaeota archaeon]
MVVHKVHVFIAHPDDTDNYSPNFIKYLVDNGKHVSLYSFSRGEHGIGARRDANKEEFRGARLGRIRSKELIRAASHVGIDKSNVHFLEIEDSMIPLEKFNAFRKVLKILEDDPPDLVLAPDFYNSYYKHPDHVYSGMLVFLALKKLGMRVKIMFFHSIRNNYYHPVASKVFGKQAVSCHRSQEDFFRYLYPAYSNIEQVLHGLHVKGFKRAEGYRISSIGEKQRMGLISRLAGWIFHLLARNPKKNASELD